MTLCGPLPSAAVTLAAVQKSITTRLGSSSSLKSKSIRHCARAATANGVGQIPIDSAPRPPFRLAVSSFGGFQTPAAQHRAGTLHL